MKFYNPIIRGFQPDPSVCRANGKYYLVTSTFQYFPGVNLFESDDLINWNQIGHCLTRELQLPIKGVYSSGGNFAPTIRFDGGRFYMTTINMGVKDCRNFYVWTDDIYGEWSDPILVDQDGIDPSLYFENGRAYFMSNGRDESGVGAIFQCEIDIATGKKISDSKVLWRGFGGRYLEAPHLYKINGMYYLVAAEGGTEYGHMVTYARSADLWGPYLPYPGNPVLTNRDLGGYKVQGAGHGDLIEDWNGNWWIYHLAFRQIDEWQPYHHLGRETCLMPVDFNEDGWFSIGQGFTAEEIDTDRIDGDIIQSTKRVVNFQNIGKGWRFLREFNGDSYVFKKDSLEIFSSSDTLDAAGSPSFAGIPQSEFNMRASVRVNLSDGEAGMTVYMDEDHHYDISLVRAGGKKYIQLKLCVGDIKHVMKKVSLYSDEAVLYIESNPLEYSFFFMSPGSRKTFLGKARTKYLSTEVAGGFTGVLLGLYSQHGQKGLPNLFREFSCEFES